MKLLLDTHVLLWALGAPERLPDRVTEALTLAENEVLVSAVSAWEIAIKQSLAKLTLPAPAEDWLPDAVTRTGFAWLPVTSHDALRVRALPWHHRDPFDRLLAAQVAGGTTLVTHDRSFEPYGLPVLWA